jgi:hypothetical protein
MRSLALLLILSAPALADVSEPAPAPAPVPPPPPVPACGGPSWTRMRDALAGYCARDAAPSEARGCRVVLRAFDTCSDRLSISVSDGQRTDVAADLRDPANESYAWFLTFSRRARSMTLETFKYRYDDCDCC